MAFLKKTFVLSILVGGLLLPLFSAAQTDSADILRVQIREALLADPRSMELTEEEFDALVESLAVEAETQGVAEEYVPVELTFEETAPVAEEASFASPQVTEPVLYGIILFALGVALVLLRRLFDTHAGNVPSRKVFP